MATDWRALATEQAEVISSRIRDLLSSGKGYIRAEFGVDLGLTPELYPSWAILSTAVAGLLVVLVLSWAAVCGSFVGRKKRGVPVTQESGDFSKAQVTKTVKPDEQRKKTKKKPSEKKAQSNGRSLPEPQQEVKQCIEISKPSLEINAEKGKKNKKKSKPEEKTVKSISASDGKEADDGFWETKVSNREKRQQKRKDKGSDGSGGGSSPGGVEFPAFQVKAPPAAQPIIRKNKVLEPMRARGKGESILAPGLTGWRDETPFNGGWSDISMKLPVQLSASEGEKWPAIPKGPRNTWGQENEGSWSGVEGRMKTEPNTVTFSILSLKTKEPVPPPAADLTWERPPVEDDWSGFNGTAAADPSSDWSEPTELWGNYEDAEPAEPPAPPTQATEPQETRTAPPTHATVTQGTRTALPTHATVTQGTRGSDDDKEKGEPTGGVLTKSKKKKKKKIRLDEEGGATQVCPESRIVAVETTSLPLSAVAWPSDPIPSSQKISDPSFEAPKPSQKKKVRRET
ncbi:hypothetical protein UPYG_G00330600 [Umbra pygmaea]|uniref:Metadherin n=1 Tax=Umbra pygmaea TaxID=75934 RepID=A0ABD0VZH8_UMBPY